MASNTGQGQQSPGSPKGRPGMIEAAKSFFGRGNKNQPQQVQSNQQIIQQPTKQSNQQSVQQQQIQNQIQQQQQTGQTGAFVFNMELKQNQSMVMNYQNMNQDSNNDNKSDTKSTTSGTSVRATKRQRGLDGSINKTKSDRIIIEDGSHILSHIIKNLLFFLKYLQSGGFFVVEDFNAPKNHDYLNDCGNKELFFDEILKNIKNKNYFKSNILSQAQQKYIFENIETIEIYKGKSHESDIAFLKKK